MATVSCGTTSERFEFVERYRELGVTFLCKWLGVTTGGFYAWKSRQASKRFKEDKRLLELITRIFVESCGRYGSPRVHKALAKQGVRVGRKRVERLMREAGLKGRMVRVTHRQPEHKRYYANRRNILAEVAAPTDINQVWVGDVTYLKVKNRWHYLATVMDLYSRRIIGWSLSSSRTSTLTGAALHSALKKRGNPKGVLLHTDRGGEYMSREFQNELTENGLRHSVNRPGHCTDNAFMESFFHSLKAELIRGTYFRNVEVLRNALSGYINHFYNRVRMHSSLDFESPIEYELRVA